MNDSQNKAYAMLKAALGEPLKSWRNEHHNEERLHYEYAVAANTVLVAFGLPTVTVVMVAKADQRASGHSDYMHKMALYLSMPD